MTNEFLESPASCTPVLTPTDCQPYAPTPVTQPPAAGVPQITPEAPPISGAHIGPLEHLDGWSLPDFFDGADALGSLEVAAVFSGAAAAVGATALAASWLWTLTPVRLRNFAFGAGSLPLAALALDGWSGPREDVLRGVDEVLAGMPVTGVASASVAIVPTGMMLAALVSARYADLLETRGRKSPARTQRASWARDQREMAAAKRMSRNTIPLTCGMVRPEPVIGRAARRSSMDPAKSMAGRLTGRHESLFTVPWLALREHVVWLGNPGSGKTTAMVRTILSFWATAWRMHQQWWRSDRPGRPLAITIDIKGARDARATARKVKAAALKLGIPPERVLIWPDGGQLSLWVGTADDLRPRLEALVGAGMDASGVDPAEAYYLQMRKTIIHLVVDAPDPDKQLGEGQDPPRDSIEFLRRMDAGVLRARWANYPGELSDITAVTTSKTATPLAAERATMANLFRELGSAFDGDRDLTDYDLVYCCLEGTTAPALAKAQFSALIAMIAGLANTDHGRCIELFCDEFAQVCGDDGAARIVELLRSAGVGSVWFAQSWMGVGPNDDARHRLIDSCSGGIFAMRSYGAGQLAEKIGTRPRLALSRKLIGGHRIGDEGNVQPEDTFLVPPAVLANFGPGDIVHVRGGKAVFGHVSPLDIEQLRPLPKLAESTSPQAVSPALTPKAA
ncbi:hypothetical protein [Nocardia sp. NBC_00403]|uniref:hypothetical protein n=1 Tax=Nocardia sp. NBC_00403 TaxID=2975990 RepID=UPI002E1BCD72